MLHMFKEKCFLGRKGGKINLCSKQWPRSPLGEGNDWRGSQAEDCGVLELLLLDLDAGHTVYSASEDSLNLWYVCTFIQVYYT